LTVLGGNVLKEAYKKVFRLSVVTILCICSAACGPGYSTMTNEEISILRSYFSSADLHGCFHRIQEIKYSENLSGRIGYGTHDEGSSFLDESPNFNDQESYFGTPLFEPSPRDRKEQLYPELVKSAETVLGHPFRKNVKGWIVSGDISCEDFSVKRIILLKSYGEPSSFEAKK
jgi:hypothetical protein